MIAALLFAAAVAATPLSPEAKASFQPVVDAIARERAAQAALPPPKDDAEKLRRLGRLDQAPRRALNGVDFGKAPEAERAAARKAMGEAIEAVDDETRAAVLAMVPREGWFSFSKYGEEAARAAFLIVQHGDKELWRRFLPVIEARVAKGEAAGADYALMYDRLATTEGRPQRYGSQTHCVNGRMEPFPLEDPAKVDALRKQMGVMPERFADAVAISARYATLCAK
jgi:hypothetical protein